MRTGKGEYSVAPIAREAFAPEAPSSECGFAAGALLAVILLCLAGPASGAGAEFVDIRAEFKCTLRVQYGNRQYATNEWAHLVHCVVAPNRWFIEGDFAGNADIAFLFGGTNVISHTVLNKPPYAGRAWTNSWASNGVGVDEMGLENLAWLAFCSGPFLKQKDRVLPLPYSGAYFPPCARFDRTKVFPDELGLPASVDFFSAKGFPMGQYRVVESTNFLGWTFPLRFEVTQSTGPGGGDGMGLYDGAELAIVCHVTSIQRGEQPSLFRRPDDK